MSKNSAGSCVTQRTDIRTDAEVETPPDQRKDIRIRARHWLTQTAIFFCLLLIIGAIFLHVKQKHHLGRLHIERNKSKDTLHFENIPAVAAQVDSEYINRMIDDEPAVTDECLHCLAQTTTGNTAAKCANGMNCGIYRIYEPYWKDALSAVELPMAQYYEGCVTDDYCSAQLVRSYMKKFKRDCNGDGIIECSDYILIHLHGPSGCSTKELHSTFKNRMDNCLYNGPYALLNKPNFRN